MSSEQTRRVEAVRSGDWWAITVPELGGIFTQAKRLDQVESRAREAIAMMLEIDETAVGHLEICVEPPTSASADHNGPPHSQHGGLGVRRRT